VKLHCLLNPAAQQGRFLKRLPLRRYEPEHGDLVVRQVTKRFERARPLVVELKVKDVEAVRAPEDLAADVLVAALRDPGSGSVTLADVQPESGSPWPWRTGDMVQQVGSLGLEPLRVDPAALVLGPHVGIRVDLVELRGVDLHVAASGIEQLTHPPADRLGRLGEERERIGVRHLGFSGQPEPSDQHGTRQRDLHRPLAQVFGGEKLPESRR
jgi:hypothetical protein